MQLWTLIFELFRTLIPIVNGPDGKWRISKESLGALIVAVLGLGALLGWFTPDAVASADAIAAAVWSSAANFLGLITMVLALVTNAKRHREANGSALSTAIEATTTGAEQTAYEETSIITRDEHGNVLTEKKVGSRWSPPLPPPSG